MIHTGQFFVPDSLNMQIDKIWPYNTNPIADKWGRTRNWVDSLDIYHDAHGNGYNPEFEVLKVGSVIQQGLIGYITVRCAFSPLSLSPCGSQADSRLSLVCAGRCRH